jgi:hypothetical protein
MPPKASQRQKWVLPLPVLLVLLAWFFPAHYAFSPFPHRVRPYALHVLVPLGLAGWALFLGVKLVRSASVGDRIAGLLIVVASSGAVVSYLARGYGIGFVVY